MKKKVPNARNKIAFLNFSNSFRENVIMKALYSEHNGSYKKYPVKTLFKDKNKYIAMDNSSNDAWIEEFDNLAEAKRWLKRN